MRDKAELAHGGVGQSLCAVEDSRDRENIRVQELIEGDGRGSPWTEATGQSQIQWKGLLPGARRSLDKNTDPHVKGKVECRQADGIAPGEEGEEGDSRDIGDSPFDFPLVAMAVEKAPLNWKRT